ncbi:MAG: BadF/BadG/BcrA/BcrD ATPase family protein, partial [Pseudomonadota bacterium]
MLVAGMDIGSLTAKAVLMKDGRLSGSTLMLTGVDSEAAAVEVMSRLLETQGLKLHDLDFIVATGYGRLNVPFAHKQVTEIACHARGAWWFFPGVRTILDMGGHDCKVVRCDAQGKVSNF